MSRHMTSGILFAFDARDFDEIEISCSPSEIRGSLSHHFDAYEFV